jgi:hypothetical protein
LRHYCWMTPQNPISRPGAPPRYAKSMLRVQAKYPPLQGDDETMTGIKNSKIAALGSASPTIGGRLSADYPHPPATSHPQPPALRHQVRLVLRATAQQHLGTDPRPPKSVRQFQHARSQGPICGCSFSKIRDAFVSRFERNRRPSSAAIYSTSSSFSHVVTFGRDGRGGERHAGWNAP